MLWESLDMTIMDQSLELHHSIIRAAAKAYNAYESGTGEGQAHAHHGT